MSTTPEVPVVRIRTWRSYLWYAFVVLLVAGLLVGAALTCIAIYTAARSEDNLHATLFTIRLVEQFVHENGRWPKGWSELQQISFPSDPPSPLTRETTALVIGGSHGYEWPAEAPYLRARVKIDFDADANTIIHQDPMEFDSIKPNGPFFEYRHYGFVDSLQATLRKAAADETPNANSR